MRYAKCRKPKWYWAFSARIAGEPGALKGARRVRREAARKRPGFTQHEHGTSPGGPPYSSYSHHIAVDLHKRYRSAFAAPTLSAICPCPRASRRPITRTATDTVRRTPELHKPAGRASTQTRPASEPAPQPGTRTTCRRRSSPRIGETGSAPRWPAVHLVELRLVSRLHGLALDLHAGCQLALLDRQVPVEDPEVLHGLPAVEPAVEFLDAGLHVPADRRVPGQRGVAGGGQALRPSLLGHRVGVEGDQRGRVVAPVRVHQHLAGQRAERLEHHLDGLRGNVLAAGSLDQVFLAVDDPHPACLVYLAEVPGGEPAVGGEHFGGG